VARHTRRRLLAGLGGLTVTLAGCSSGPDSQPTATSDVGSGSDAGLADIQVTGSALVATLPDEHEIQRLTLVGPDDETVASSEIDTDTSTVELPILELDPQVAGYEHYTPGEHELVVATANGERTVGVPLDPTLEIEAVEQYRSGDSAADLGRLAVTVVNTGTGPTWVYDIAFEGSPNFAANDSLVNGAGVIQPTPIPDSKSAVIPPQSRRQYLTPESPLLYPKDATGVCDSGEEFEITVGSPVSSFSRRVRTTSPENPREPVALTNGKVCESIDVTLSSEERSSRDPMQVRQAE